MAVVFLAGEVRANESAPQPIESTLSWELLTLESTVRSVPKAKFDLLRSVLVKATEAARAKHQQPRTREEAVAVFEAIQEVFAEHNFIQPDLEKDWTDTIGDAFEPRRLRRAESEAVLAPGERNGVRKSEVNQSKPFYYVDCDMASQLILSVAERMGWDIRLVWIHKHFFVRWHLPTGERVNWDWTAGSSAPDDRYRWRAANTGDQYSGWPERRRYLSSLTLAYAKANYLNLMAHHVDKKEHERKLREMALASDPTHEFAQNSLAWIYVTDPALAKTHGQKAVQYALSAWAAEPRAPYVADTVACAYAAIGERDLGVQVEAFAIARLKADKAEEKKVLDYQSRLRQIENGGLCTDSPPSEVNQSERVALPRKIASLDGR